MKDAVRPSDQEFKAMYERGHRTWSSLYEVGTADTEPDIPWWDCLFQLENATLKHPSFPENLAVNASFSNTVIVTGISTWRTTQGCCDLRSFDQEFFIPVASDCPTILTISNSQQPPFAFPRFFGEEDDHITLLILAWTYILSARWAEIIPGASGPEYNNYQAEWDHKSPPRNDPACSTAGVYLGDVDDDAARWWAAVLAIEGGWNTSITNDKGHILNSPWHTKLVSEQSLTLSRDKEHRFLPAQHPAASVTTALSYLSSYCKFHKVAEQSHAALAATLLLPVAKFDNRRVQLSMPRVYWKVRFNKEIICKTPVWNENLNQLDGLLALSCNAVGTKALLTSIFLEPDVACNICGAWLQGTFAFLDSDIVRDQHILLRVLMKRDPSLGFLWLGAFITGVQIRSLQEARQGWWKIDLHVAAWTGTLMSFIQEPVSLLPPGTNEISRADECRLMYLSHDQSYTVPPLFPFAPFGFTAIIDTNIDVRQHAQCEISHRLEYEGLTWRCHGGERAATSVFRVPLRAKNGRPTESNISVAYDKLDNEDDDCSEMVTRNIFTWLRDEDSFPVAERSIREHEWIDNLDSDDDSPITGNAQSTAGGDLHGWLLKSMTRRSNSL